MSIKSKTSISITTHSSFINSPVGASGGGELVEEEP